MRRGRAKLCNGHNPRHFLYQLTCEEFALLVERSQGGCDRCGALTPRLVIDHDHTIGMWAVRGLVCHGCNSTVSAIERGERDLDDATRAYRDDPFHRLIPAESAGLRPVQHPGALRPRPSHDQRITARTARDSLVDESTAAKILGLTVEGVRELISQGRLIHNGPVFRRSVVERIAVLIKL